MNNDMTYMTDMLIYHHFMHCCPFFLNYKAVMYCISPFVMPHVGENVRPKVCRNRCTPWKANMEPTNRPFRAENDLQTFMIMLHVNLRWGFVGWAISRVVFFFLSSKVLWPSLEPRQRERNGGKCRSWWSDKFIMKTIRNKGLIRLY